MWKFFIFLLYFHLKRIHISYTIDGALLVFFGIWLKSAMHAYVGNTASQPNPTNSFKMSCAMRFFWKPRDNLTVEKLFLTSHVYHSHSADKDTERGHLFLTHKVYVAQKFLLYFLGFLKLGFRFKSNWCWFFSSPFWEFLLLFFQTHSDFNLRTEKSGGKS